MSKVQSTDHKQSPTKRLRQESPEDISASAPPIRSFAHARQVLPPPYFWMISHIGSHKHVKAPVCLITEVDAALEFAIQCTATFFHATNAIHQSEITEYTGMLKELNGCDKTQWPSVVRLCEAFVRARCGSQWDAEELRQSLFDLKDDLSLKTVAGCFMQNKDEPIFVHQACPFDLKQINMIQVIPPPKPHAKFSDSKNSN